MAEAVWNSFVDVWNLIPVRPVEMRTRRKRIRRPKKGGGMFNFPKQLPVRFDTLINGSLMTKEETQRRPTIEWTKPPGPGDFYTYICFDPDATIPSWIHLLVVNCTLADPNYGTEAFEWTPPAPAKGTHRYIFGLFSHQYPVDTSAIRERGGFDVVAFVKENGMTPVAGSFMKVAA
jgi:phosphatidylethanolamine-binding protein (PEBP) family uncharacterized protein